MIAGQCLYSKAEKCFRVHSGGNINYLLILKPNLDFP